MKPALHNPACSPGLNPPVLRSYLALAFGTGDADQLGGRTVAYIEVSSAVRNPDRRVAGPAWWMRRLPTESAA